MSLKTLIRFVAAIIVLTIVVITLYAVSDHYGFSGDTISGGHTGSSEKNTTISRSAEDDLVVIDEVRRKLTSENTPEMVLGNPAFEKAREMLDLRKFKEARVLLRNIVEKYPGTPAEREAYRVLGEMRLDDLLEQKPNDGKFIYTVKPNDSYLKIVRRFDTNLDMVMYLNGLTRIDRLRPKDKLVIMPLDLSLRIIPKFNQLFLINKQGEVVKFYEPVVDMTVPKKRVKSDKLITTIEKISAYKGKKKINVTRSDYREASKKIQILNPKIEIISEDIKVDNNFRGVILSKTDVEELVLLLRRANTVEIRY